MCWFQHIFSRKPTLMYTGVNLMYSKEHILVNHVNQYLEDTTFVRARSCIQTVVSIPHPASFSLVALVQVSKKILQFFCFFFYFYFCISCYYFIVLS